MCHSGVPSSPRPFLVTYLCFFPRKIWMCFAFLSEKWIKKLLSQTMLLCLWPGRQPSQPKMPLAHSTVVCCWSGEVFRESRRRSGSDLKCHQVESFCSKIKCRLGSVSWQPEMSTTPCETFNYWIIRNCSHHPQVNYALLVLRGTKTQTNFLLNCLIMNLLPYNSAFYRGFWSINDV